MRAGSREHVSHVAMLTPRTPLHLGRLSRVQRYSSSMHRAMEEDSLMTRYDDDLIDLPCSVNFKNDYIPMHVCSKSNLSHLKICLVLVPI